MTVFLCIFAGRPTACIVDHCKTGLRIFCDHFLVNFQRFEVIFASILTSFCIPTCVPTRNENPINSGPDFSANFMRESSLEFEFGVIVGADSVLDLILVAF